MERGRNELFFSGERRESALSCGSFIVYVVVTHNILWLFKKQSKFPKTSGSMELSILKTAGSQ